MGASPVRCCLLPPSHLGQCQDHVFSQWVIAAQMWVLGSLPPPPVLGLHGSTGSPCPPPSPISEHTRFEQGLDVPILKLLGKGHSQSANHPRFK